MLNLQNIFDTIDMIDKQHLDIRTITMGISLLDCVSEDPKRCCDKIYDKICARAEHLVKTGEDIESEFGIPIVNKRISVTPIALIAGSCETEDYVPFAKTLDRAAKTCGVNFIGGYSALVQKGFAKGDELLLRAIPQALAETVEDIARGTAARTPQDHTQSTYAPMLTREMSAVDWTLPAQQIHDQVRGLIPWPCAVCELGGQTLKLFSTRVGGETAKAPGCVIGAGKQGIEVACGDGRVLRILELQAQGGRRMAAADYLRGHEIPVCL